MNIKRSLNNYQNQLNNKTNNHNLMKINKKGIRGLGPGLGQAQKRMGQKMANTWVGAQKASKSFL